MRFLALTTPVYLAFFVILMLIRSQGYDSFSDQELLIGVAHVFVLQGLHWLLLYSKKEVSRDYMKNMLWFMVYNNILIFSYWTMILEFSRSFIYILAPMSAIALFSIATMKQTILFNFVLVMSLGASAVFSVLDSQQSLVKVGLDWIYLMSYFIVSIWLANLSDMYGKNRKQLRSRC